MWEEYDGGNSFDCGYGGCAWVMRGIVVMVLMVDMMVGGKSVMVMTVLMVDLPGWGY